MRHIAVTPLLRRVIAAVVIGASVFGFFETVQFAVVGVSIALGAAAIAVLDYRILLAVMAVVMLAAAGYLARVPGSGVDTTTRDMATASNRLQR